MRFIRHIYYLIFLALLTASCRPDGDVDKLISDTYALIEEGDYAAAQLKVLRAEDLMQDETDYARREELARLKSAIFYNQNVGGRGADYAVEALEHARAMNDTALIILNLHNLGLLTSDLSDAEAYLQEALRLAKKNGYCALNWQILDKLAQIYIINEDFGSAQSCIDELLSCGVSTVSADMEQCFLWLKQGDTERALTGYLSINPDSLTVHGKLMRANAIGEAYIDMGDFRNAIPYRDSTYFYTDSIRRLDGSRQVAEVENEFYAELARARQRFRVLLWSSTGAVLLLGFILFIIWKNTGLRKRQIELSAAIAALNARIAELEPGDKPASLASDYATDAMMDLVEEKFRLSYKLFKGLPQHAVLVKLNFIRDFSAENKAEVKEVYDAIIGRFSDCCSDLRRTFPEMTKDDCVFCTMNYIGCSRCMIAVAMAASEEALRRRKSRIKQKMPEVPFRFFFDPNSHADGTNA